eukprot:TRINITY_DN2950_c0_g4_i2.p1 TRINITY_DN2950_c0_g4~~TRINITY_DN2950_c0_g4_i2.p1  ORF type:complete len:449 (+),score=99.84 TRINITY_DN2950_c0_g4_i2:69-1415(+)
MGSENPKQLSHEAAIDACVTMFRERLARKAYRNAAIEGKLPPDVAACEADFLALVRRAVEQRFVDRPDWGLQCEDLSNNWAHVCYWLHPGRLEDFIAARFGTQFKGKRGPVLSKDDREMRKQVVRAQKYECAECGVVCNSLAQYETHERGQKHLDMLRMAASRQGYVPKAPLPCSGHAGKGLYYIREDTPQILHSDGSSQSTSTAVHTPQAIKVQQAGVVTATKPMIMNTVQAEHTMLCTAYPIAPLQKLTITDAIHEIDNGPPTLASVASMDQDHSLPGSPSRKEYATHSPYGPGLQVWRRTSAVGTQQVQGSFDGASYTTAGQYQTLNPSLAMFYQAYSPPGQMPRSSGEVHQSACNPGMPLQAVQQVRPVQPVQPVQQMQSVQHVPHVQHVQHVQQVQQVQHVPLQGMTVNANAVQAPANALASPNPFNPAMAGAAGPHVLNVVS